MEQALPAMLALRRLPASAEVAGTPRRHGVPGGLPPQPTPRDGRQAQSWPFAGLAALAAPLCLALAASRPARAARARAPAKVVRCATKRKTIPSRAAGATLTMRIWDMLGLHPKAGKDEIRAAYKEFVRENHPDLNNGQPQNEKFTARFQKLTAEYNRVMNMRDDEFWLESFDTGITRMATKRVDGPSLNSWERRFRSWARTNDLLEVDELSDEEVDCRKRSKYFLDACDEDPDSEECEIEKEEFPDRLPEELQRPAMPDPAPAAEPEGGIRPEQIFIGIALLFATFIALATLAIIYQILNS